MSKETEKLTKEEARKIDKCSCGGETALQCIGKDNYYVVCFGCRTSSICSSIKEEVIQDWNANCAKLKKESE